MTESEPGISLEKAQLRDYMSRLRSRLSRIDVEEKSNEILDQILELTNYVQAKIIGSYVSKDNEVDTRPLIRRSLDERKRVVIPIVKKNSLELGFSEITNLTSELTLGSFGVLEPKPEYLRPIDIGMIDVLFVPGIVWDHEGYRIGWGRGYFDHTLKMLPDKTCSIGLGFDSQLVQHIPRGQFDLPVKILVTESKIIHCRE